MHNKLTITLVLLLSAMSIIAQHTDVNEIRAEAWPSNDPYAKLSDVPEKWQDASAVILFQSFQRAYTKKGRTIRHANAMRKRVKIQDNSALEAFSEFVLGSITNDQTSFKAKSDFLVGEIKIIKPNGTSFLINLDEAVDDGDGGKKVALSNLEIDDIIDYYYYEHEAFPNPGGHAFQPVISTLGEEYPILHQNLGFKVSDKFYVNFNTYNGAPEVKTIRNTEDETVTYMIEDHNRDAEDYIQWNAPYRTLPAIKFQVIQAEDMGELNRLNVFTEFPSSKLKQKTSISDVLDLAERSFTISKSKHKAVNNFIESSCPSCSTRNKLDLAYKYFRYYRLINTYEAYSYLESGLDVSTYYPTALVTEDEEFINLLSSYFLNQGIAFDILATVPKKYGTLDQVLLAGEINYLMKVKVDNEDIYLSRFSINTQINEIPYELQGQEAYLLQYTEKGLFIDPMNDRVTLPESTAEMNRTYGISEISFRPDNMSVIDIKRHSTLTGHNKDFDRGDLVTLYDIISEEEGRLQLKNAGARFHTSKNKQDKFIANLIAARKKSNEARLEQFEASSGAEYEFELEDYRNAQIINSGRWEKSFDYTDQFSTSALLKKAGKNYIFEIGQLIGKQMAINDEQKNRNCDIYMAFPRSFNEEVIVDIPSGYSVEGIDRLNSTVENSTGSFVSSAEIVDGKLLWRTSKSYSHSYEPLSNWSTLLEFLEAAYDISQEKILFKKISTDTTTALRDK